MSIDGETATIEVNDRPTRFRTTVVKPYLIDLTADATDDSTDDTTVDTTVDHIDNLADDATTGPTGDTTDDLTIIVQPRLEGDPHISPVKRAKSTGSREPKRGTRDRRRVRFFDETHVNTNSLTNLAITKVPFEQSRRKELDSLFDYGVFDIVDRSKIPKNS